jgi:hypothetical protein
MTETKRPSLNILPPAAVTKYMSGDGKVHNTEIDAIAHETFLAVKGDLSVSGARDAAAVYDAVCALARKYEFVPRSAA